MIGFTLFKIMESFVLRQFNIQLPPEGIAVIDSAYLCLLWLYGQGPRTIRSLLMTALLYGAPFLLHQLQWDKAAAFTQRLPHYASRVGMAYSAISALAVLLIVVCSIPALKALLGSPQVKQMVQQMTQPAADAQMRTTKGAAAAGEAGGSGRRKAAAGSRGYEPDEDDEDATETVRTRHSHKLDD